MALPKVGAIGFFDTTTVNAFGFVDATAKVEVSVTPTGVAGTGAIGTVSIEESISLSVSGVAGTGEIGSAVVQKNEIIYPWHYMAPGQPFGIPLPALTGTIGTVTVGIGLNVSVNGVAGTSAVGDVSVGQGASVTVVGV